MPIPVTCECGKAYKVKEELAGKKVRCAVCKGQIAIPRVEAEDDAEADALRMLLTEEPVKPRKPDLPMIDSIQSEPPRPQPKRASSLPDPPPEIRRPKPARPKRARDDGERGGYSRIYVSPAVITGVLMMVGATVWFFGALAFGVIFIYPPIMFVLGLIAVVKGFLGHEED
jgi:hypothetical protein